MDAVRVADAVSSLQEFLSCVDADKDQVESRISSVERDWKAVEDDCDRTCKSLEAKVSTLTEQHDLLDELTKKVSECEDLILSRSSLGAYAYDNRNLERIKVSGRDYATSVTVTNKFVKLRNTLPSKSSASNPLLVLVIQSSFVVSNLLL